jgi:hypothetical protein
MQAYDATNAMSEPDQPAPPEPELSQALRDALLAEYREVTANFRLLTDIRFRLLALLPIAAVAATAVLTAGDGHDDAAAARAAVLSAVGLLITVALATYNVRNDQLYDELVGRAGTIERGLGLTAGAFGHRPRAWLTIRPVPVWGLRRVPWRINHGHAVAWIYAASAGLWLYAAGAAIVELAGGRDRWLALPALAAALLPAGATWLIRRQRKARSKALRACADAAMQAAVRTLRSGGGLAALALDRELFLPLCEQLGDIEPERAEARASFYSKAGDDELGRRFLPPPGAAPGAVAAHFVALITDLPPGWIHDCWSHRR